MLEGRVFGPNFGTLAIFVGLVKNSSIKYKQRILGSYPKSEETLKAWVQEVQQSSWESYQALKNEI